LEPIKKSNPGITYADLFTLAGVVAIEEMGGPKIKWRPGRSDNPDGKSSSQNTRLPDADKGKNVDTIKHIREIFNRMGFSDQEIVALLGAHSLGRCYTDRSGYSGPWTKAPTAFSNEYYRELLENTWTVKKWKGPLQYEDKAKELMMLPADMALLSDGEFKKWVEIYAKDEARFSKDFAAAFGKLLELGVKSFEKKGWWPF
jgi:cytochrome c peroxidase